MFRFVPFILIVTLFAATAAAQNAGRPHRRTTAPAPSAPIVSPFRPLAQTGSGSGYGSAGSGDDMIGLTGPIGNPPGSAPSPSAASGAGSGLRGRGAPGPTIRSEPSAGLLAPEAIRHTILSHMTEVDGCYARARRDTPTLRGRLVAHFTIRGDGSVSDASIVEAEVPSDHMNVCLLRAIGGWHFPQPAGQGIVTVNYPFNLVDDHPSPPPRAPAPPRRGHRTPPPPPAPAAPAAPTLSSSARAT